jgi:hypothetical protein
MATLSSNSIFGSISGKVGDVVYSSWKGIPYMRKRPVKVSNPKTAAQLDQRAKFTAIIKFLKPLTPFLRLGFKSKNAKMSAHNAAMSYNLANAIMGTYPDYAIDYSKVLISRGNIGEALRPAILSANSCEIEFRWAYNPRDYYTCSDDIVVLVIYNSTKKEVITAMDGNRRIDGSQTITLPEWFVGDEVHCYISFQDYKQKVISNSLYVGSLILA